MTPVEYILPLCTFAGTLTVLAIGFIYNNGRISDLRSDIDHRFGEISQRFSDLKELIDSRLSAQEQRIDGLKELLDAKLARQKEMMLAKFAPAG